MAICAEQLRLVGSGKTKVTNGTAYFSSITDAVQSITHHCRSDFCSTSLPSLDEGNDGIICACERRQKLLWTSKASIKYWKYPYKQPFLHTGHLLRHTGELRRLGQLRGATQRPRPAVGMQISTWFSSPWHNFQQASMAQNSKLIRKNLTHWAEESLLIYLMLKGWVKWSVICGWCCMLTSDLQRHSWSLQERHVTSCKARRKHPRES